MNKINWMVCQKGVYFYAHPFESFDNGKTYYPGYVKVIKNWKSDELGALRHAALLNMKHRIRVAASRRAKRQGR